MEHKEAAKKLSAFLDNELPSGVKSGVESHIKECPECASEVEKLALQQVYLKKDAGPDVPVNFKAKVNIAIETQTAARAKFNVGRLFPIPVALSALILIFSAFMVTAPLLYGTNDDAVKAKSGTMAARAVVSGFTGSVFAPAAFAKFCEVCNMNACSCCKEKCGSSCKNGGNKNGN